MGSGFRDRGVVVMVMVMVEHQEGEMEVREQTSHRSLYSSRFDLAVRLEKRGLLSARH